MSVWLRPAQVPRQPAPAFSRDEITRAAIELADHGGLEAVSMRRIAARIGSAPTSLYWYFSDKDELYELMVDAVIGQVQLPERPSGDWRADLRSIALATRAAMSSHPWFAQLGIHPVAGPQTVRFGAAALRSLEALAWTRKPRSTSWPRSTTTSPGSCSESRPGGVLPRRPPRPRHAVTATSRRCQRSTSRPGPDCTATRISPSGWIACLTDSRSSSRG